MSIPISKADRLKNLNLSLYNSENMKIGPIGTIILCESLVKNHSILDLNLGIFKAESNEFGSKGAFIIGEFIRKNQTIQTLNVSSNQIDSLGMKKVAEGLKFNKSIKNLDLCYFI